MKEKTSRRKPAAIGVLKRVLEDSLAHDQPYNTEIEGRTFTIFPGVHSPQHFKDAPFILKNLDIREGETFLEIGAGCGIIAVSAALAGAKVTCTDICETAVANTRENFRLHGLSPTQVYQGDLFEPVRSLGLFDTIFWNFPFVYVRKPIGDQGERNVIDPGYQTFSRFASQATDMLSDGGMLKLCFSPTVGNEELLWQTLQENGFSVDVSAEQYSEGFWLQLLHATPAQKNESS